MSHLELIDAVAKKTVEDSQEIRRRGFSMKGPADASHDHDPDCLFDLVDLPELGTVDWDEVLDGCRKPFLKSTLKARKKKQSKSAAMKIATEKQIARAA